MTEIRTPAMLDAVARFVDWCAVQSIDTRKLVTDVAEYDDDADVQEFDDVLADWINTIHGNGFDEYLSVSEFNSHWTLPDSIRTRMAFRSFAPEAEWNSADGVIALFIDEKYTRPGDGDDGVMSYMHVGQHGSASLELLDSGYLTTPSQRAPLVAELEAAGYRIDVVTDCTRGRLTPPRRVNDGARTEHERYGERVTLQANRDAVAPIMSRRPFANRSFTLHARAYYVPGGATVEYLSGTDSPTADGSPVIRVTTPGTADAVSSSYLVSLGVLPAPETRALLHEFRNGTGTPGARFVYVVYSYATPISWEDTDGRLVVPPVRYSVTTSKHQTIVRGALSARDVSADAR